MTLISLFREVIAGFWEERMVYPTIPHKWHHPREVKLTESVMFESRVGFCSLGGKKKTLERKKKEEKRTTWAIRVKGKIWGVCVCFKTLVISFRGWLRGCGLCLSVHSQKWNKIKVKKCFVLFFEFLQPPLGNSFLIVSYNMLPNEFDFSVTTRKALSSQLQFFTLKGSGEPQPRTWHLALIGFYTAERESKGNFRVISAEASSWLTLNNRTLVFTWNWKKSKLPHFPVFLGGTL